MSHFGTNTLQLDGLDAGFDHSAPKVAYSTLPGQLPCPVEAAARIIGQKWTLQIVHHLLHMPSLRFCELQEALGGVNPSTLSSRLKMLEEAGMVERVQISDIPPHVEYSLTPMGHELDGVLQQICRWSSKWLCENGGCGETVANASGVQPAIPLANGCRDR